MKDSLLRHLVCPNCKVALQLRKESRKGTEIESGELHCASCSMMYPVVRGIPRFVPGDAYVGNFSFQWNQHRTTQVDSIAGHQESLKTFWTKTELTEAELKGKLALDVGVGTGRFLEVASRLGAEVIGIDLSFAVEAAYKNMGTKPGVHIVQADVFNLPFAPQTFDVIYSLGVLHHTPDTHKAFSCLPPLVKRGGIVAIWVYVWAGEYSRRLDRVRSVTTKMPQLLLYALCWLVVPILRLLYPVPVLRLIPQHIPVSNQQRGVTWDVLDTFDAYSPRYQWKHTDEEVVGWFREADLESIKVLGFPVSVRGTKSQR